MKRGAIVAASLLAAGLLGYWFLHARHAGSHAEAGHAAGPPAGASPAAPVAPAAVASQPVVGSLAAPAGAPAPTTPTTTTVQVMPSGARVTLSSVHGHARTGFPLELRLTATGPAGPVTGYSNIDGVVWYPDNQLEKIGFVLTDAKLGTYVATAKNPGVALDPGTIKVSVAIHQEAVTEGGRQRVPALTLDIPRGVGVWSNGPASLSAGRDQLSVPVVAAGVASLSVAGRLVVDDREVGPVKSQILPAPLGDGQVVVALPEAISGAARTAAVRDLELRCQPSGEVCDRMPELVIKLRSR